VQRDIVEMLVKLPSKGWFVGGVEEFVHDFIPFPAVFWTRLIAATGVQPSPFRTAR
jgi:hypothetical protein